jgi:hypothetical protein
VSTITAGNVFDYYDRKEREADRLRAAIKANREAFEGHRSVIETEPYGCPRCIQFHDNDRRLRAALERAEFVGD